MESQEGLRRVLITLLIHFYIVCVYNHLQTVVFENEAQLRLEKAYRCTGDAEWKYLPDSGEGED